MPEVTPPLGYDHAALRLKALQVKNVEKVLNSLRNQRRSLGEDIPDVALTALDEAIERLKPIRKKLVNELPVIVGDAPVGQWIDDTHGLAKGLILLMGILPAITDLEGGPSALWKYCGLHVTPEGKAPKGARGQRLGFDPLRRAYALKRVADPIVKVGGPYRAVYDDRKAYTLDTHPPMLTEGGDLADPGCEFCQKALGKTAEHRAEKEYSRARKAPSFDCSNVGGVHWTDGHRHADALRVLAKEVLIDLYRVCHGQAPRVGVTTEDQEAAA